MGTAFNGVDVVYVRIYLLRIACIVLEGDLDRDDLVCLQIYRSLDKLLGAAVKIVNELTETFLRIEDIAPIVGCLEFISVLVQILHQGPLVCQREVDAFVKVCKLAKTGRKSVVLIDLSYLEDLGIRMEGNECTCILSLAYNLNRLVRLTFRVLLDENLAFAVNLRLQIVRKGVHAGYTDTVETAGHLIAVLAELTAGMEDGQNDFESRAVLLLVHSGRDASSVIFYSDGIIFIDSHFDVRTVARERLIDTVVNHLIYKMVQTSFTNISDIHRRPLPYGLKAFKNLNTVRGVLLRRSVIDYFFTHISNYFYCLIHC